MGREIRKVPPNWEHPIRESCIHGRKCDVCWQPLYDRDFVKEKKEWIEGLLKWERGEDEYQDDDEYWDYYGDPPKKEVHRPYSEEEATWFQLYETVSEGTPVSPPFATKQELADYLAKKGDFWDQRRLKERETLPNARLYPGPWGEARANKFVFGDGWAPSGVVIDGKLMSGIEAITNDGT